MSRKGNHTLHPIKPVPGNVGWTRRTVSVFRTSGRLVYNFLTGLVVEDAISGLKSGHAAGALTLAVCTSTSGEVIVNSDANPNYMVSDLTKYAMPSPIGS